jgi:hypothetical protein
MLFPRPFLSASIFSRVNALSSSQSPSRNGVKWYQKSRETLSQALLIAHSSSPTPKPREHRRQSWIFGVLRKVRSEERFGEWIWAAVADPLGSRNCGSYPGKSLTACRKAWQPRKPPRLLQLLRYVCLGEMSRRYGG